MQLLLAYKEGIEASTKERDFMVFLKIQQHFQQVFNNIREEEFRICFQQEHSHWALSLTCKRTNLRTWGMTQNFVTLKNLYL
jgi:hypothetical protein